MVVTDTLTYYRALFAFMRGGYSSFDFKGDEATRMKVHVFSLCLALKLWDLPHYRKSSYAADVRDNFRNVALPGTGVPLSILASHKLIGYWFIFCAYPFVCFVAAIAHSRRSKDCSLSEAYRAQLLAPRDWFSLWRINSRLTAWHSLATRDGDWHDYGMENKWAFLEKGLKLGVSVSPILKAPKLCIKHKNEEGGMGIHFFDNALDGGDWIIQEVMENEDSIASLLPPDAPLSTFRVMTASMIGRKDLLLKSKFQGDVVPLSCVFRAGRAGALTDHKSILFDVDVETGKIRRGTTNEQWYQIGKTLGVSWGPPPDILNHPDTDKKIAGYTIPDFHHRVLECAIEAHKKMLPRVPIAGWDVVLSKNHSNCLLEVNLSCNFFRGSFDPQFYFDFVDRCFTECQQKLPL